MKIEYVTQVVSYKKYKIKATQKVRDGHLEGGYVYCVTLGKHIIGTGHMSCFAFSNGLPEGELLKALKSYIGRY